MRIYSIGTTKENLPVREGDVVLECGTSPATLLQRLDQENVRPESAIALVDLEGLAESPALLAFIHRAMPRMAIGLVTRNRDRAAAFALLRDRQVDRIIPRRELDTRMRAHIHALATHAAHLNTLATHLEAFDGMHFFVTGATGFLGGHFLRYLLRCSTAQATVLTRTAGGVSYDQRLTHLEKLHPGRIQYVEGDVREAGLGLTAAQHEVLSKRVDAVWHFAANTRFEEILRDDIFQTNAEGTRNMLAVASRFQKLKCFHHVSTAYASGNRSPRGVVPEARLERPGSFKNPYEESKFLAESDVAESGLPTVVYRPSIILGERVSGLCDGQTVYKVAQLIRLAQLSGQRSGAATSPAFRVVVDPETNKNLIPADDVIFRMLRIASSRSTAQGYYNLTHSQPTPMAELIGVIAAVLDIPEYKAVPTLEGESLSGSEALLQRISAVFKPYMLNSDPRFDTRATDACVGGGALRPVDPEVLRFLLQSFFEQHYDWNFQPRAVSA